MHSLSLPVRTATWLSVLKYTRVEALTNHSQNTLLSCCSAPSRLLAVLGRGPALLHHAPQVQRAIKRQRSLAAGELPPFGAAADQMQQQHHQAHQLQQQPPGSLAFLPKCLDVLNRVYGACQSMEPVFGLPVKDVFYRPVSETFPQIAPDYYARIPHPMTFRTIEERIRSSQYTNAQSFADVRSGGRGVGLTGWLTGWPAVQQRRHTAGHSTQQVTAHTGCWQLVLT